MKFVEVVDRIYDTLLDNVGMSEHHKRLNVPDITASSVAAESGKITIHLRNGGSYLIQVTEVQPPPPTLAELYASGEIDDGYAAHEDTRPA